MRLVAKLVGGLLLVAVLGVASLELALSGPRGLSLEVLYRTARNFVRDATVPNPPSLAGFSNSGPNVIIIVLDCYRYDYLDEASPNLRAFGEQARWYERYYAAAPWTKPSTASLFTGLPVRKHYIMKGGGTQLPEEAVTLAERMQEKGFSTAGFVWNPHITRRQAFDQGFDLYVDNARRGSKSLLYHFFDWLDRERPDRFFAYIHFQGTHDPYYADNDLVSLITAPGYEGDMNFAKISYKHDVRRGIRPLSPEEAAHLKYVAEGVARKVDRQAVGAFLERFEASGLPENTMLAITSDHGDQFFEHGSVSHGANLFDEEIRVPLLIRFPESFARERGFSVVGRDSCPASTIDLLPTSLDFAGIPVPDGLDGASLIPGSRGDEACSRTVISEMTNPDGGIPRAALVSEKRKLLVDYAEGGSELFDLEADPAELRDVSGRLASERAAMSAELSRRLNDDGSSMADWTPVEGEIPKEQEEALRALGYLE